MNFCRLITTSAIVMAMAGVLVAPAVAYDGDWTISQSFERTTSPSFSPGFNPNDIDSFVGSFDNRRKTLSFTLNFFDRPSDGSFEIHLGKTVGSICSDDVWLVVNYDSLYVTQTYTVESRTLVPDSYETSYTTDNRPPSGTGWVYSGLTGSGYQWVRFVPSHYVPSLETRTATVLDPNRHKRIARLIVSGIDSDLSQTIIVANNSQSWNFLFADPLLNRLQADCGYLLIPGRRVPYYMSTNVTPPPVIDPPTVAPSLPIVTTTPSSKVLRSGSRLTINNDGAADSIQIRVNGRTITKGYARSIKLRASNAKRIHVRFLLDGKWTPWKNINVQ